MPALTNNSVGSFCGTSGAEATTAWSFLWKKSRKWVRISFRLGIDRYCRKGEGTWVPKVGTADPLRNLRRNRQGKGAAGPDRRAPRAPQALLFGTTNEHEPTRMRPAGGEPGEWERRFA